MLQQTQVATVLPYYQRWLERFPTAAALAAAPESDVLHAWQGLGYYSRARNLHAVAKAIGSGPFPEDLQPLPGIGRYTANAVATFAFDRSVPLVEANIARLLARLLDLQIPIDTAAGRAALWSTAEKLLPKKSAGQHNSALMDLGALVCTPRSPRCPICPVARFCAARAPEELPRKKPRTALKLLTEHHAFSQRDGHVLLEQSASRWRGLWILPRTAPNESTPLYVADFPFTHHRITLAVHAAAVAEEAAHRWFPVSELAAVPLPSPHRRALEHLLAVA